MNRRARERFIQRDRLQRMPSRRELQPYLDFVRAQAADAGRKLDPTEKYLVYSIWAEGRLHPSFYIGKGIERRPTIHFEDWSLRRKSRKNSIIKKALREGRKLIVEIFYRNLSEELALALERFLISRFGRLNIRTGFLTNLTDGGDGLSGLVHTSESKAKMSASHKGYRWSEASKRKMSATRTGVPHAESTKRKISKANRGRKMSAEAVRKNREGHLMPISTFTSRLAWCNPLFAVVTKAVGRQKSLYRCRYCLEEFVGHDHHMLAGNLHKDHYQCGMEAFDLDAGTRVYSKRGGMYTRLTRIEVDSPQGTPFTFSFRKEGVIFFSPDGSELSRARLPASYMRARIRAEQQFSDYGA